MMQAHDLENYSYEDYLAIDKSTPDTERYELIFGHIYMMSGASAQHQDVVGSIFYKLKQLQKQSNCFARIAPYDLKIECSGTINVIQPDVILYCQKNEIPCAIFEVLSPSTAYKDKSYKKDLYESCGILNYLLVDPLAQTIDKFILENKKYFYDRCYGVEDKMSIECLDVALSVHEMFE